MWTANNQINNIVPILAANIPTRIDFIDNNKYVYGDLTNTNPILTTYLYAITVDNLDINKNFYKDLIVNVQYNNVNDSINNITTDYTLSTIELLDLNKNYITPFNIQGNPNLNNLYLFTPYNGILNIEVTYNISNINKYNDIDCFIFNHNNITNISYQENYSTELTNINSTYLRNINFNSNNKISITYSFPVNLSYLNQSIGFNTATIYKFNALFFNTSLLENTSYLEVDYLIYKNNKYYNLLNLDNMFNYINDNIDNSLIYSFISNPNYYILISK